MRHLVRRGFAVAVILGLAFAASRRPEPPAPAPRTALEKALACYRVYEEETPAGTVFTGIDYRAEVAAGGLDFSSKGIAMRLGAPRVEQGGRAVPVTDGTPAHPAFAVAQIDRGPVVEEYVFENRRLEQLFRLAEPVGTGALVLRTPVTTNLAGPVIDVPPSWDEWRETELKNGGLIFTDETGAKKLLYHSAVAIDAEGKRQVLDPRFEGGEIVLEVPASFMARAAYPLVVDPWMELDFSASGGGISQNGLVSQNTSMVLTGGQPVICWADERTGNFEIYLRYWNGFAWKENAGSGSGRGISSTDGDSTNPSVILADGIYVAWQDDTSGPWEIYFKKYDNATGQWIELKGSATRGGVSKSIALSTNPSVSMILADIPSTARPIASQIVIKNVPVIAWQEDVNGSSEIYVAYYYPGDPGDEGDPFDPLDDLPPIPEEWYGLGGSFGGGGISNTVGVSEKPVMKVDSTGRLVVAWQDTGTAGAAAEYDIYLRRYSVGTFGAGTQVHPNGPEANGTWDEISGSGSGRGCCAGVTSGQVSVNPSLALDPSNNPYVAWQEFVAGNSEIYLQRSIGGGAWSAIGGSGTAGGISATAGQSNNPSLDLGAGNIPSVAWADDTSGNFEIYVRRFNATGGTWDEVGIAGSASPGAPAGISNTSGFSLAPNLQVDAFGNPAVCWTDGANGSFDIFVRKFYSNSPVIMRQTGSGGAPVIQTGATTTNSVVELRSTVMTEIAGAFVGIEVEVRPIDSAFVGTPTHQSALVDPATGEAVVAFSGAPNTSYHWRARSFDQVGRSSTWLSFGGNADGQADFIVSSTPAPPPGTPPPPSGLTATAGNGVVNLSWTASAGPVTSYNVKRSTTQGIGHVTIANVLAPTTTFTDNGVTNGTTYFYIVTALNGAIESVPSNEASATPQSPATAAAAGDDDDRCGLLGAEVILLLGLLAAVRRRRRH